MNNLLKALNTSPVLTYRWLGVNSCNLEGRDLPVLTHQVKRDIVNQSAIKIKDNTNDFKHLNVNSTSSMGKNFEEYVNEHNSESLQLVIDEHIAEPVVFNYRLDNENLVDQATIIFEENARGTLIFVYKGKGSHLGIKEVISKKGAKGKIIKVNLLEGDSIEIQETIVQSETEGDIEIIHINIGENTIIDNINIGLEERAKGAVYGLYLGANKDLIDLNYVINHNGKKSESNMSVKGALLDYAEKTFRGTIDFKTGASDSDGKEEEYVILLSKHVRNKSMPLILCGEDDVRGEHAASCGRIDEEKLFYLMSRGLTEEESKKMIIEGNFNPILDKITDEKLVKEIVGVIKRRLI